MKDLNVFEDQNLKFNFDFKVRQVNCLNCGKTCGKSVKAYQFEWCAISNSIIGKSHKLDFFKLDFLNMTLIKLDNLTLTELEIDT
jgi:hypothetical protein